MNRAEQLIGRISSAIADGRVLSAYNQLQHEETTCGPYHEAVEPEHHWNRKCFAVTAKGDIRTYGNAPEAALAFLERVGSGRAREALVASL